MKRTIITALALVAGATAAFAQANPFTVEGTIRSITNTPAATPPVQQLVCGNMTVQFDANTVIRTPTRAITAAQFANVADFINSGYSGATGALKNGFRGGTCIANGIVAVDAQGVRTYRAVDLQVDVTENVLVGEVTSLAPFSINGLEVRPETDGVLGRIQAGRLAPGFFKNTVATQAALSVATNSWATPLLTNGFEAVAAPGTQVEMVFGNEGFGTNGATVPVGSPASADGYFSHPAPASADQFGGIYAHTILTAATTLLRPEARTSIARNACRIVGRNRDTIDANGGCVFAAGSTATTQSVRLQVRNGTAWVAPGSATANTGVTATCNRIPGTNVGRWDYRGAAVNLNGTCPTAMRTRLCVGDCTATVTVAAEANNRFDVVIGFR